MSEEKPKKRTRECPDCEGKGAVPIELFFAGLPAFCTNAPCKQCEGTGFLLRGFNGCLD